MCFKVYHLNIKLEKKNFISYPTRTQAHKCSQQEKFGFWLLGTCYFNHSQSGEQWLQLRSQTHKHSIAFQVLKTIMPSNSSIQTNVSLDGGHWRKNLFEQKAKSGSILLWSLLTSFRILGEKRKPKWIFKKMDEEKD